MVFYSPVCFNYSFHCFIGAAWLHGVACCCFLGVAKRWPPGCSATVQILHFCTCFQDNWHFKGAALVVDCLPLTSTLLALGSTCDYFIIFHWSSPQTDCPIMVDDVVLEQTMLAANCMWTCTWTFWMRLHFALCIWIQKCSLRMHLSRTCYALRWEISPDRSSWPP